MNKVKSLSKTLISATLVSIGVSAGIAIAEQPSYSYVEGGYTQIKFDDGFLGSPDGYILKGSVDLSDNFYVVGSYSSVSGTETVSFIGDFDVETDLSYIFAGAGFKAPVSDNTSFFTQLSYVYADTESKVTGIDSESNSENGFDLMAGFRSMVGENTELNVSLAHTDVDGAATTLAVGARHYFTDSFGVFADVSRDDFDTNNYSLGASFRF